MAFRRVSLTVAAAASLALALTACHASAPTAAVEAIDTSPGTLDVTVVPEPGLPVLQGLEVDITYDPAALTVQSVGPGPDNARIDTVIDTHTAASAKAGRFTVLATDSRRLPLVPGAVVRISYAVRKPGATHIDLSNVVLAGTSGERLVGRPVGVDLVLK